MLADLIAKVLQQHRFTATRGVEGTGRVARTMAERHVAEEIKAAIETQEVTTNA
jgi:hypothetical protein